MVKRKTWRYRRFPVSSAALDLIGGCDVGGGAEDCEVDDDLQMNFVA